MKHILLAFLFFILSICLSMGVGYVYAETQINIPTCPKETAYMLDENVVNSTFYWSIEKGFISMRYNQFTIEYLKKKAKEKGVVIDLKQCPPAIGHMRTKNGMVKNLPMGFFDDEDNWMNQVEFDAERERVLKESKKEGGV